LLEVFARLAPWGAHHMPDQSPSEHPCPASSASSSSTASSSTVALLGPGLGSTACNNWCTSMESRCFRPRCELWPLSSNAAAAVAWSVQPVPVGVCCFIYMQMPAYARLPDHACAGSRRSQRLRGGPLACIGSCGALRTFLPHSSASQFACHRCLRSATRCRTRIVGRRWKRRLHAGCFALL
jgi:hypothetical protein